VAADGTVVAAAEAETTMLTSLEVSTAGSGDVPGVAE
jgi:hypothetical protein